MRSAAAVYWSNLCEKTASLSTEILDLRGFDLSRILILRGGTPRPIGNFPESLSQAISARMTLVARWGAGRLRPIFILRILRPRIFESKFRNHCAKKSVGALRKSTYFV